MKLNFELCKNCNTSYRLFGNHQGKFYFACDNCKIIYIDTKEYKPEKFNIKWIYFDQITEEEWIDINQMNIVRHIEKTFNKCPYQLEHIVEN